MTLEQALPETNRTLSHKISVGMLGAGSAGQAMLRMLESSGKAKVSLIAEPYTERRKIAVGSAAEAMPAAGPEAILGSTVEGIVIATPNVMHHAQAISAVQAGKAVFCLAPLAKNAAQVREMVLEAQAADRLLFADLSLRYVNAVERAGHVIRSGSIGQVFAVEVVGQYFFGPIQLWYYDPVMSGGGCLIHAGADLLDAALWCLGFPKVEEVHSSLFSEGRPLQNRDEQVEDYAAAQVRLATGALLSLSVSWHLHAGQRDLIRLCFYGTQGGICIRSISGSADDFVLEQYEGNQTFSQTMPSDNWREKALLEWIHRIPENNHFDARAHEYIYLAELVDKIYERS